MNDVHTTLAAMLFDGRSLEARPVKLELGEARARIVGDGEPDELGLDSLRVSPRTGHAPRFVVLPNGAELLCADDPALDHLTSTSRTEGPVAWLERRLWVAVLAVLTTIGGATAFYFFGLPWLAGTIAARIPLERERAFGERTLLAFDQSVGMPTDLDAETLGQVRAGFSELVRHMPKGLYARLEFRSSPGLGPNAFALPGGVIIITDRMIERCTVDESIAVLAHEVGHVAGRHALRHFLQELGVSAFTAVVSADAANLSLSASVLPVMLAQAQYSQDFEEEADETGFALLRQAGWSPELFASCLRRISDRPDQDGALSGYLSSHPPNEARVARARDAARGFVPRRKGHQPAP